MQLFSFGFSKRVNYAGEIALGHHVVGVTVITRRRSESQQRYFRPNRRTCALATPKSQSPTGGRGRSEEKPMECLRTVSGLTRCVRCRPETSNSRPTIVNPSMVRLRPARGNARRDSVRYHARKASHKPSGHRRRIARSADEPELHLKQAVNLQSLLVA